MKQTALGLSVIIVFYCFAYVTLRASKTLDIVVGQGNFYIDENDKNYIRRTMGERSLYLSVSHISSMVFMPIMKVEAKLRFSH